MNRIINIALYLTIIIVSQLVLMYIPNIQFTFILMVLFIKNNNMSDSLLLIICYTLIMGVIYGFTLFTIITFISWSLILLHKYKLNIYTIVIISILQMWVYAPLTMYLYDIPLSVYIIADTPFTIVYMSCNVLLYIWIYDRLDNVYKGEKR
jgi:hypothetical protein